MALIAGFGGVAGGQHKSPSVAEYAASAKRLGNKLFAPALAIPLVIMIGTLSAKHLSVGGVPLLNLQEHHAGEPGRGLRAVAGAGVLADA